MSNTNKISDTILDDDCCENSYHEECNSGMFNIVDYSAI